MSYSGKTIHDFGILRKYTDTQYKLISMSIYHPAGTETERGYTAKGKAGNAEKLENSISRTRARIQELALCNPWDWFVTLTIDRKKQDRSDLKSFMKSFTQFFRDCRKKNRADMQYLFIPEHHQDGNWHLHGFLKGLPFSELHAFQRTEHLPYRILQRLDMNKATYTWKGYAEKFGYAVLEPIENHEAAARYITKYITKESMHTIQRLNDHAFYASHGLKQSEVVMHDVLCYGVKNPDYQNDYVSIKWFDTLPQAMRHFGEVLA